MLYQAELGYYFSQHTQMATFKIATLLLLLQIGTPPATQEERPVEKASIEGVILRSESGEPLGRAEVKLSRVLLEEDVGGGIVFFDGSDPESRGLPSVLT